MLISVVGLNHTRAPFELRERLAYTTDSRAAALSQLKQFCAEAVILDTCNRSEVYALAPTPLSHHPEPDYSAAAFCAGNARVEGGSEDIARLMDFLCDFHQLSPEVLQPHLYIHLNQAAIAHLFSVASGIDSLVVGEAQILSQVRAAFEFAVSHSACGPILSALFRHALRVGKRARAETRIGHGSVSLSSVAIDRAQQAMGSLTGRTVLVIGAGQISALAVRNLRSLGVQQLWITNRTLAHAEELAQQVGGTAIPFERLSDVLNRCDVIFTSTAAPHAILSYATVQDAVRARTRPLCIVDLGLPRNVDPAAAQIPNVRLFNLDDLQAAAHENKAEREKQVVQVRAIIAEELEEFWCWYAARPAAPLIAELRARGEAIRAAELNKALRRLRHLQLSERDRNVIAALATGIVNKLLATPTVQLKERVSNGDGQIYLDALRELFDLPQADEHDPIK